MHFEINFNQRQARTSGIIALLFFSLWGMSFIFSDGGNNWYTIIAGIAYTLNFIHKRSTQYIRVKHGVISKNFGGKINVEDLISVKKFAGDYVLSDGKSKIVIDPSQCDKNAGEVLKQMIAELTAMSESNANVALAK